MPKRCEDVPRRSLSFPKKEVCHKCNYKKDMLLQFAKITGPCGANAKDAEAKKNVCGQTNKMKSNYCRGCWEAFIANRDLSAALEAFTIERKQVNQLKFKW